jgi:hypothetical protein
VKSLAKWQSLGMDALNVLDGGQDVEEDPVGVGDLISVNNTEGRNSGL